MFLFGSTGRTTWVVAVLAGLVWAGSASARTLFVQAGATGANNGSSWANAYTDLQGALAGAQSGDEVWVAAGTYRPDRGRNRFATFDLPNGVGIYGGFAGTESARDQRNDDPLTNGTILSGDLAGDDGPDFTNRGENSLHVVSAFGVDAGTVLDGFTVSGGNADAPFPDESGGGMVLLDSSPTIARCVFADHSATGTGPDEGFGGAMLNVNSSPSLTDCIIRDNRARFGGGVSNLEASRPVFERCRFLRNTAQDLGGGIHNEASHPQLTDCDFESNSASIGGGAASAPALTASFASAPVFVRCRFEANEATGTGGGAISSGLQAEAIIDECTFLRNTSAQDGGAVHSVDATLQLTNSSFHGNFAQEWGGGTYIAGAVNVSLVNSIWSGNVADSRGGAILVITGTPTITNCTISGNEAGFRGGGVSNTQNASPLFTNCILWGNRDSSGDDSIAQMHTDDLGFNQPMANYSLIQNGWSGAGGAGVIDADPRLRRNPDDGGDGWGVGDNDDFGDLRLAAGSPCIDSGDNAADTDQREAGTQPIPDRDFDGQPRRLDDPSTADGGNAPAGGPVVDIGAFEFSPSADVPGDLDGDGDVDLGDYLSLTACVGGPGVPAQLGCEDADLDGDGDVDLGDVVQFQAALMIQP